MRTATAQNIFYVSAIFVILFLMGLVGNADYEDALAQEAHYVEMVCSGHWPDFDNLLAEGDCHGVKNSKRD